ncbi:MULTISPECIES: WbqC family protein [Persicobacter]|uniref:WbqC family protein n=1 Tax=Persicobacter diffluens TaxID=981 RepID=A0AAN4W010_9BACT|nr:WbqC family protein [Persicobacter sp. CCB-QB2]GJM62088.1 hypothetical protein PEDI_26400 [Persicobacter diffluens]
MNQAFQNKDLLIELHYFPSVEYLACILQADKVLLEVKENFVKQTYRNRCRLLTSQGARDLTIPIVAGNKKQPMEKIQVDDSQNWRMIHWRSIKTAYGKAPFYEHYIDYLEDVFFSEESSLLQFNYQLLKLILKLMGISKKLEFTTDYVKVSDSEKIIDMRGRLNPKKSYTENDILEPLAYPQLFGNEFVANLSVLDLLFCEGPNAKYVIQQSVK